MAPGHETPLAHQEGAQRPGIKAYLVYTYNIYNIYQVYIIYMYIFFVSAVERSILDKQIVSLNPRLCVISFPFFAVHIVQA